MLLGINQNCYRDLSLIEFIKKAKRFQGIELEFKKLKNELSNNLTFKNILDHTNMYDLKVINMFELEDFSLCSEMDFRKKIIPNLKTILHLCYKLECDLITITPSFELRDIPKWRIIRKTKMRIEELLKICKNEDIRIGFNFINHPQSSIQTFSETKQILDSFISNPKIGFILDTFYFGKSKEDFKKIIDVIDIVFLVQLGDYIENQSELEDNENQDNRIFPGEGVFKFKELFTLLKDNGYRGFYSIDISSSENQFDIYKELKKKNIFP